MKFDKLVKIIKESLSSPKNKGGTRVYAAQQSAGPSGYSSSPVGKTDALELAKPLDKWEFNPNEDMDKGGVKKQAKAWRILFNAFSLLSNDKNFQDEVKTISDNFDKRRDSYKNILGIDDEEGNRVGYQKYDEESRVNTLPATLDKQKSRRTGYEAEISKRRTIINYSKMGPSAKFDLERSIKSMQGERQAILDELNKDKISNIRKTKLEGELQGINNHIDKLETRLQYANIGSTESLKSDIVDYQDKIKELDKKIEKNEEELMILTDRTTKIQSNNEENNDKAIDELKDQVNISAKKIKNSIMEDIKDLQLMNDVSDINWDDVPKDFSTKIKMLESLESTDPKVNPIFGYLDSFNNWYYETLDDNTKGRVKDLDSREFNPQLNITKIRDYMSLPFVRAMSMYASSAIPKMSLKPDVNLVRHEETFNNFISYIDQFPSSKNPVDVEASRKAWNDPETKDMLRSFIAGMGIENKDTQYSLVNRPFNISRSGANNFLQLKSSITSDMKRFYPKTESFDNIYNKIITEKMWCEDDFKIDTMELLSLVKQRK